MQQSSTRLPIIFLAAALAACTTSSGHPTDPAPDAASDATALPGLGYHVVDNTMRAPSGDVLFLRGVIPLELRDRVVVAPHFYPPYVHEPEGGGYGGDDQAHEELLDDLQGDWGAYLDMGVALWSGEYGGMTQSNNFDLYFQHLHTFFMEHFVSSALWDHHQSEGGFAFLDESGALKTELAPVFRHPLPTLLPSKPTVFEADWVAGTLEAEFQCREGGIFAVLLTAGCACEVPEGMPEVEVLPNHSAWACDGDGDVAVNCACI